MNSSSVFSPIRKLVKLSVIAAAVFAAGCGGSQTPQVTVNLTPTAAQTLDEGQTVSITASVANDPANKGVSWSLSPSGEGTLANTSTTAATYNAPTSITSATTVTVTAVSLADSTKTATLTINLAPPSVSLTPNTAQTTDQGKTVSITASVANDPADKGVTWSLNPSGQGALTNTTITAATYNAPSSVATASTVTVTAASVADNTKTATLTIDLVPPPSLSPASIQLPS